MKKGGCLEWPELVRLAQQNSVLEGQYDASVLPRLLERCAPEMAQESLLLNYRVAFRFDEQGLLVGQAVVDAEPLLVCERCMKAVGHSVRSELELAFVKSDERAAQLPRSYEPVVVGREGVLLSEVLEDEALLALPMFVYHDEKACQPLKSVGTDDEKPSDRQSPFAGLAELLKSND